MPYFAQLSSLVIAEAKQQGLRVLIEPTLYSRDEELNVLHGAQSTMVDGLIFSPLELGQEDVDELQVDYPLVLLGERIFTSSADHIATENVEGAKRPRRICWRPGAGASPSLARTPGSGWVRPRCDSKAIARRCTKPGSSMTNALWFRRACGTAWMARPR